MIPVPTLYDEYIDRPKLTEQKNPFEYVVPPPPSRGVGTILMGIIIWYQVVSYQNLHSHATRLPGHISSCEIGLPYLEKFHKIKH